VPAPRLLLFFLTPCDASSPRAFLGEIGRLSIAFLDSLFLVFSFSLFNESTPPSLEVWARCSIWRGLSFQPVHFLKPIPPRVSPYSWYRRGHPREVDPPFFLRTFGFDSLFLMDDWKLGFECPFILDQRVSLVRLLSGLFFSSPSSLALLRLGFSGKHLTMDWGVSRSFLLVLVPPSKARQVFLNYATLLARRGLLPRCSFLPALFFISMKPRCASLSCVPLLVIGRSRFVLPVFPSWFCVLAPLDSAPGPWPPPPPPPPPRVCFFFPFFFFFVLFCVCLGCGFFGGVVVVFLALPRLFYLSPFF